MTGASEMYYDLVAMVGQKEIDILLKKEMFKNGIIPGSDEKARRRLKAIKTLWEQLYKPKWDAINR